MKYTNIAMGRRFCLASSQPYMASCAAHCANSGSQNHNCWSKDQTFDRDLYAFRSFFDYDKISVGVLVTRSETLNAVFGRLGILRKYGASTTHMGKLLPRLQAGRHGGCPVLVFGITEKLLVEG